MLSAPKSSKPSAKKTLNKSARTTYQSEKPQIVWSEASDRGAVQDQSIVGEYCGDRTGSPAAPIIRYSGSGFREAISMSPIWTLQQLAGAPLRLNQALVDGMT